MDWIDTVNALVAQVTAKEYNYEDLANWENEDAVNDVQIMDDNVYGYNDETIDQSNVGQFEGLTDGFESEFTQTPSDLTNSQNQRFNEPFLPVVVPQWP
jgi:hypothetical protein